MGGLGMKIGCIQLRVGFGKVDENYERAEHFIREAAAQRAEIITLPELWNTGFALEEFDTLADENGARTKAFLTELAKELQVHIVGGSVSTKQNGKFYNTMYVVNKAGEIVCEYNKVHLFTLVNEGNYLEAGDSMALFELDGIPSGAVICYDIRFPEWFRSHTLEGAKVMFVPAQWPTPRIDHWKTLLQARAIENQCFVVAINRIARNSKNFNGQSMIIEPWGEILWTGGEEEELAVIDVDFSKVDEIRTKIPVYEDRRPELYGKVADTKMTTNQ